MSWSKSTATLLLTIMSKDVTKLETRVALITGVGGQDGAYLSQLLLDKGYKVFGTSRDVGASRFESLRRLGIGGRLVCCRWHRMISRVP